MTNIKSITPFGKVQTHDLEVDHPDHQYYLANGMLTSNSHSTLYSFTTFFTAYLKANYPVPFLIANLMSEVNSNTKEAKFNILKIKEEIRARKIKILPPDVNKSDCSWKIVDDNTIMAGLDSLKNMGKDAIPEIIAKRPFTSYQDLIYRTEASKVRSPSIQAMAASGSLDDFQMDRKIMFHYASDYRAKLRNHMDKLPRIWAKENNILYKDKDGNLQELPVIPKDRIDKHVVEFIYPFPEEKPWTICEVFALEEYYMGEGISGDYFELYPGFFDNNKSVPFEVLKQMFPWENKFEDERLNRKANTHYLGNYKIRPLEAVVTSVFSFTVKKEDSPIVGQVMARINIQDAWGEECCLICFPEAWEIMKNRIKELSGGFQIIEAGIGIRFLASFQWENENSISFVLSDILDFKPKPSLPEDRSSKKVKMPRIKTKAKDIKKLEQEEMFLALEDEMLGNGISTIDSEEKL